LRMVGGIDALIALQGVEDPMERRRRSLKGGRNALNVLDELKVGLLGGVLDHSTLLRLKSAAMELKSPSGDPGLDGPSGRKSPPARRSPFGYCPRPARPI
jgi:hypothetical protein